ncbi:hypothetical protein J6590_085793 [Homalodisca vitripennis]|nr:hypothetical protein J6590_085793 [Homalodisca vitripennis]
MLGFQATGTLIVNRIPPGSQLYTDTEVRVGGRGFISQIVRDYGQIAVVKWFDNKPVVLFGSYTEETPKRDQVDQLAYKTELADQLLLAKEQIHDDEEEDGFEEILPPVAGAAQKRKKPNPLPSDTKRTSGVKHMPQLV